MKITYIYHSCFLIEGEDFTIVVDYYKDSGDQPDSGIVHDSLLNRPGAFYVLSTHSHPDHFNPEILKWKQIRPDIRYIFSSDILKVAKIKSSDTVFLKKLEEYRDELLFIKAYGSTDIGISFYIEAEGKTIFHAGDLNNWHWSEESTPREIKVAEDYYQKELGILTNDVKSLDVAMFPVDSRLGKDYMKGAEQFVDVIQVKSFIPMHFGKNYESAALFEAYARSKGCDFMKITHKGQEFIITN